MAEIERKLGVVIEMSKYHLNREFNYLRVKYRIKKSQLSIVLISGSFTYNSRKVWHTLYGVYTVLPSN